MPTTLVRPMLESDLPEVRRIFRVAFGTFLGVPKPEEFWIDREYIFTRFRANPSAALVAERDGAIAGSNFLTRWGSFGFFGPLTIRPDLWDQKIGQQLLGPTMELFEQWGVRATGLLTFPQSPKHVGLYQKFGFWPRFLTAFLAKNVEDRPALYTKYSALSDDGRAEVQTACRQLTDAIFEGLDATSEIRSVHSQNLGETVLIWNGDLLDAFAVCHCGEGSEAGADTCYIKFAAVRPGPYTAQAFEELLGACNDVAAGRGLHRIEAGVNTARSEAYRQMLVRGFRAEWHGVAMHGGGVPFFNRPGAYVLDDWR